MSRLAHILFLLTAVAPMCAVFGINRILEPAHVLTAVDVVPFVGSAALVFVCWALLRLAITKLESQTLKIKSAKNTDRDLLPFVLAYLLPLATANTVTLAGNVVTVAVIAAMVIILAFRSHLSVANPVVALLGYRFYEVQVDNGIVFILLSKKVLLSTTDALNVHHAFDIVFVRAEG
jgi:hypothetical protein